MPDSLDHDAEVFAAATRLPPDERAAYLTRACGDDGEMRRRLDALLLVHTEVGDFLANPNQESGVGALADFGSVVPGTRVGRYKLVEKIGEGGCGVIYLAEQEEPVRREVALKIIKPGMDTKDVIARFEAERQALALMDHPGIAKVFDAGETESGRPYFVMELIRGIKITEYCDLHLLTTEARLELFVQVCHAVQHAHQKGIIHRDLKPSNILVTATSEGSAQPVVIDFGIAKATTALRLTDKTLFTAVEMLVGTPTYMSPEQTALTSVDVDTRSDIYSLGVLLYELLTGSTPFDVGELLQLGMDEVRRAIREQEPPCPSARLGKMMRDILTDVAKHRRTEPQALIRSIRGDLDWIAMKSLEKDRTRRYETANGLALDVKRFLEHDEISARPPSTSYRLQKMFRRHRVLFAGISAFVVLLVVSLVLISESLAQERRARREAEFERERAEVARRQAERDKGISEAEATKSRQVTRFLEEIFQGVGPSVALGRDTKMLREILDRAAIRIGSELSSQPAAMAELQTRIGLMYSQLGVLDQAEAMHRAAQTGYRKLHGDDSKEVAASLSNVGAVLIQRSKPREAVAVLREALSTYRKSLSDDNAAVVGTMVRLAIALNHDGQVAEAETLVRTTLAIRRKLLGNEHLDVTISLNNLAVIFIDLEKFVEAETAQREVLAIRRKLLPPVHPDISGALMNLGWTLSQEDSPQLAEAGALIGQALAMNRKLYGDEHREVAAALSMLSEVERKEGKFVEAEHGIHEAITIATKALGEGHQLTLGFHVRLGRILADTEKLADAESAMRQAIDGWRKYAGPPSSDVSKWFSQFGLVLFRQNKLAESEASYRESVSILMQAFGRKNSVFANTLVGLAAVLHQGSRDQEAETLLIEATTIVRQTFPEGSPRRRPSLVLLHAVLEAQGKTTDAEAIASELDKSQPTLAPVAANGNPAMQF